MAACLHMCGCMAAHVWLDWLCVCLVQQPWAWRRLADIVGFTEMSKEVEPAAVMEFLNDLYTVYDDLCSEYNVYKVETVGDCYVSTPPHSRG